MQKQLPLFVLRALLTGWMIMNCCVLVARAGITDGSCTNVPTALVCPLGPPIGDIKCSYFCKSLYGPKANGRCGGDLVKACACTVCPII